MISSDAIVGVRWLMQTADTGADGTHLRHLLQKLAQLVAPSSAGLARMDVTPGEERVTIWPDADQLEEARAMLAEVLR